MINPYRKQVLEVFKSLHKARKFVFMGDNRALEAARKKINEEFNKYRNLSNPPEINERLEFAKAVEKELRANVIQGTEVEPGKYRVRITSETTKFDNVPYKDCPS